MHENLFSSSDKEHFPQPQLQSSVPALSLLRPGGREAEGRLQACQLLMSFPKAPQAFFAA